MAEDPDKSNSAGTKNIGKQHLINGHTTDPNLNTTMPNSNGEYHVSRTGSESPVSQPGATLSDHGGPTAPNGARSKNGQSPMNGAGGGPINPRSCVTCRKRKVRCDKRHPCINCNKASIECVFPGPGRAPRRSRKPPETELLARLRKLEGMVKDMGKEVKEEDEEASAEHRRGKPIVVRGTLAEKDPGCNTSQFFNHLNQNDDEKGTAKLVKDFGRLVVEEGRSRYVSNKFWTSLSEEVRRRLGRSSKRSDS